MYRLSRNHTNGDAFAKRYLLVSLLAGGIMAAILAFVVFLALHRANP